MARLTGEIEVTVVTVDGPKREVVVGWNDGDTPQTLRLHNVPEVDFDAWRDALGRVATLSFTVATHGRRRKG